MYKYLVTWLGGDDDTQTIRKFEKKEDAIKQGLNLAKKYYGVEIFQRIGVIETTPHFVPDEPQEDDGWIEWNGGECPVDDNVIVDVRLNNGRHETGRVSSFLRWDHQGFNSDIIAYRIAK